MKAAHPEALATTRTNPGETLRTAREAKHWSVAEVAAQLNLTSKRLEQLEAGDFDKLPGHTFARGYVRAYGKLLGMDQNRLVLEFDHYTGTDSAGSSVHSLGRIEEPVHLSQGVLRIVSFLLLVLLGGAGFYWWQEQSANRAGDQANIGLEHIEVESADGTTQIHPLDEPEDQAVAEGQAAGDPQLPEPSAELAAQPEAAAPDLEAQVENAPVAPVTPAVSESASPSSAPAVPVAPVAPVAEAPVVETAAATAVAPGEGLVRLQFSANCWAQVTDATGKVLFSALKRSGESLEVKGKAPLELRLGYARGAQVSYNGQAVDVAPFTSGETARLKLGQ